MQMQLVLPNNYVELDQEEMIYLDGGWGFGKNWWNSTESVTNVINYGLVLIGIWSPKGQAAINWIKNNTKVIEEIAARIWGFSQTTFFRVMASINGALSIFANFSIGGIIANGIDYADKWFGSAGYDGYCFG